MDGGRQKYRVTDIAAQAGLSRATVDRVLHERVGVRPETVAQVERAIRELDRQRSQVHLSGTTILLDLVMQATARFADACRTALEARRGRMPQPAVRAVDGTAPSIGFVSTWNARCGIAEYTRYLATNLPAGHRIAIFANRALETVRGDEEFVIRSWDTQHAVRLTTLLPTFC